MTTAPIQAVIFDMGGVLLRTRNRASRERLATRYHKTYDEINSLVFDHETAVRATVGEITEAEHWQEVGRILGIDGQELKDFEDTFWADDAFDYDLLAFIRSLRPAVKTALLSNAWDGARESVNGKYHFLDAFDDVIFSAEIHQAKPDPRIYQLALQRLGVAPSQAIFVDDFSQNINAANALGIHGVLFLNSQQATADVRALLNHG
jgi:epoxide hydrolase-like predicted phosphatase